MSYRIGIVGATGAVGQEVIRLLRERQFPGQLTLLASARSAGKTITVDGQSWTIQEARANSFAELDVAIFSIGSDIAKELAPAAVEQGCVVIDNSSAFRMDTEVPLVIPEVNAEAALAHKGIIANPNCTAAVSIMGLYPLHQAFGLQRVFASSYQAVSGAGAPAMDELKAQVQAWCKDEAAPAPEVFPHPIAFNLIPHIDTFQENGYTGEEIKMQNECRKIMGLDALRITTTCIRVPVFRAHSISIYAEFERPVDLDRARQAINGFDGVELCDDPAGLLYPMPLDYSGKVNCGVGRLRKDTALDNGLAFWVVGDQLWKGAALNAVQIAELLHQRGALRTGVTA